MVQNVKIADASLPVNSSIYFWVCFGDILRNVLMSARFTSAQTDLIE